MRWSIRTQLLVPLFTLLLGVVAVSAWTAYASAHRAWQQLETQVHNVARILATSQFPITQSVMAQTHGLSGAEFVYAPDEGETQATMPVPKDLPAESVVQRWQDVRLGN